MQGKAGGAHFSFIDTFINNRQGSYAVGNTFTIADAALFSFLHNVIQPTYGNKLSASYPDLVAYINCIAELPSLRSYLSS